MALDDIRDRSLGPWNVHVKNYGSGLTEEIAIGDPDEDGDDDDADET